jgi:hypothetical protein
MDNIRYIGLDVHRDTISAATISTVYSVGQSQHRFIDHFGRALRRVSA